MTSQDDRYARRLAEIRAQEAALDAEDAQRAAAAADQDAHQVVQRRRGGKLRDFLILAGVLVAGFALIGVGITLSRLAGHSMDDTTRAGQATVTSCNRHGPITNKGYGYWESCATTIKWADGQQVRETIGAVFSSADIGKTIEVGDSGRYRQSQNLARADVEARPWLRWVGWVPVVIGGIPLVLFGIALSARRRKR
ncbi:DUF6346 domain-containing protein [Paractinoplanes lichenicola]|uniref:DUF3592 domain-containing protein n=1 Tax=Paractinoplanes lichenicola TaxID=2802976 RepID=A0ABS1VUS9_9ACTN|nr:DUF6346 domain-containing protein [Actinoplanes lichenicola]MBL7258192.1 hypothetical protein [Actinoplanes lichenicola]